MTCLVVSLPSTALENTAHHDQLRDVQSPTVGEVKHEVTRDVAADGAAFEPHLPAPENPDLLLLGRSVFLPPDRLVGPASLGPGCPLPLLKPPAHDGLTGDCAGCVPGVRCSLAG